MVPSSLKLTIVTQRILRAEEQVLRRIEEEAVFNSHNMHSFSDENPHACQEVRFFP